MIRDTNLHDSAASRDSLEAHKFNAPKMGRSHWSRTHELEYALIVSMHPGVSLIVTKAKKS